VVRRATADDAEAVGRIFLRARDRMTYLPRVAAEHRPLLGGWFLERSEIWVADEGGSVVGFVGLRDAEITHLYVGPDAQNRGIGSMLLAHAREQRSGPLELWVFQRNAGARRFYERHGFRLSDLTDGAANMEREPDARYEWHPAG
jgi:GNAT superfamily N-acetyltransferase